MTLDDVKVKSRINYKSQFFGSDTPILCKDKKWFGDYPYEIYYNFNSRGFRGPEWPNDLKNAIWCLGDSATLGTGSPIEHTWAFLLEKETGIKTINVSIAGASNEYIARMSQIVSSVVKPLAIVHQWSFIHRREEMGLTRHFVKSTEQEDIEHFVKSILSTKSDTVTVHSFVPNFEPGDSPDRLVVDADPAKRAIRELGIPNVAYDNLQIDYGRDMMHYDIQTSKKYVEQCVDILASCRL